MYFKLPKLVIMRLLSYPLLINNIYVCDIYIIMSQARGEEYSWLRRSLPCRLLGGLPIAASKDVQRNRSPIPCVLVFLLPWLKCRMRVQMIQFLSTGPMMFTVQYLG